MVVATDTPLQATLFGAEDFGLSSLATGFQVTQLDAECRILHRPYWIQGADELFFKFLHQLPWRSHQRWIVDRAVLEPRLSVSVRYPTDEMSEMASALGAYCGRSFKASWANLYRDGADGIAWHADRYRPGSRHEDVALVSLGGPRVLRLRALGGGPSWAWKLMAGDLLLMCGPVQQRFEHSIPKATSALTRISLVFRCPMGREFDQTVISGSRGPRRLEHRN